MVGEWAVVLVGEWAVLLVAVSVVEWAVVSAALSGKWADQSAALRADERVGPWAAVSAVR